jgi:hypothetical protein
MTGEFLQVESYKNLRRWANDFFNALPSNVVERSTVLGASFQINYTNVTMQRTLTSKLKTSWHLQYHLKRVC